MQANFGSKTRDQKTQDAENGQPGHLWRPVKKSKNIKISRKH